MLQAKITEVPVTVPDASQSMMRLVASVRRARAVSYGIAIGCVAVAFGLRWALYGILDTRLPFAFFVPAAMVAAWHGGLGPGLLAAGAGLLLGDYFFLPPHISWGPLGEAERTALTVYALTSTITVILFDNLHVRIRRLECDLKKRESDGTAAH